MKNVIKEVREELRPRIGPGNRGKFSSAGDVCSVRYADDQPLTLARAATLLRTIAKDFGASSTRSFAVCQNAIEIKGAAPSRAYRRAEATVLGQSRSQQQLTQD